MTDRSRPCTKLALGHSSVRGGRNARLPSASWIEAIVASDRAGRGATAMRVRDGMSDTVLSVGPNHTLREAARFMAGRRVGAAVVLDPDGQGPGIITERDVLDAIGGGQDPDAERVRDHLTADVVYATPDWSLEEAAVAMGGGGGGGVGRAPPPPRGGGGGGGGGGFLGPRNFVRCWTDDGAICD